jgi:hypothetical protein
LRNGVKSCAKRTYELTDGGEISCVDAVSLRNIDVYTTERVNKKDGKVVSTETRVIAKDGRSYTTTVKGTTAKGEPIDHRMVFDKQ